MSFLLDRFTARDQGKVRVIELNSIDNVRDFGGMPVEGNRIIPYGLFYRGSALHGLTGDDIRTLFDINGIACTIDLRCGWECEAKPSFRRRDVDYLHIPFYDKDKVGIDYRESAEGTEIVGKDIACDPDHFYRSLSNPLTVAQIRECIRRIFACATSGKPVYCHCSGGKDRTGIIAMLVQMILGASEDDIMADYLFTNVARDKTIDEVYARFLRLANGDAEKAQELTDSHRARPENLIAFWESVCELYGSREEFFVNQLGIDENHRARLCSLCTEASAEAV